jgi:hypothetical protein
MKKREPAYLYYLEFADGSKGRYYARVRNAERDLKRTADAVALRRFTVRTKDDVVIARKPAGLRPW